MYRLYFMYKFAMMDSKMELTYDFNTIDEARKYMNDMIDGYDNMGKALGQKNSICRLRNSALLLNYSPKNEYWGLAQWGILSKEV